MGEQPELDWVLPDEGGVRWMQSLAIFKDSARPDLAKKFVQYVLDPEGQRLVTGDSIVLRIRADEPTIAVIDRIRLGYREDLRAATLAAGYAKAVVTLAGGQGD